VIVDSSQHQHEDPGHARLPRQGPRRVAQPDVPGAAVGNAAIRRLVSDSRVQRAASGGGPLDETIARAIHAKRGSGQELDPAAREDLGASMGHDFSDVRVHTDTEADSLNKSVKAEAFTTGRDVFFREGKYDPASSAGRKLLAHELTHVVQQRDAPPAAELTVSDPGDASERQASAVADHVASPAPAAVARQEAPPEEDKEEEAAASPVARQEAPPEEEKEEVAAPSRLDRQDAPEEETEE
jgi:hypothetical protein